MTDNNQPEEEQLASGGGALKGWHYLLIAFVAIAAGAFLYYWFVSDRGARVERVGPGGVTEVPEGSRTVLLYFADRDEMELVPETRQVAIGRDLVDQVQHVLRALTTGPEQGGVSTIPEGTRVLGVFYDPGTFTVFVDFSSELVGGHPGGSAAEYYTVSAIMKTISENFPEVEAVQILIEGLQVGTIAGHINAYKPFLVRDWR